MRPLKSWPVAARGAWWAVLAVLLISALAGLVRLQAQQYSYSMPDEDIPVAVIRHIRDSGRPDTNWARTDVAAVFRYDQFNFSSYYLAGAAATLTLAGGDGSFAQRVRERLRYVNGLLGAASVVLAGLIGLRLGGGPAALLAAALTATHVSLFQDSSYARPEAFVTVLTCLLFFVATSRGANSLRTAAFSGAILGVLLACKISFAVLAPFIFASVLAAMSRGERLAAAGLLGATGLAGFLLGVPYAALAPSEYLHGVLALSQQYASGHWPHGVPGGSLADRLAHSGTYLLDTAGMPAMLLALAGAVLAFRSATRSERFFLAGVLASGTYFLQSSVFFERNLSHVLPFLFALAGVALAGLLSRLYTPGRVKVLVAIAATLGVTYPAAKVTGRLLSDALPGVTAARVVEAEAHLRDAGYAVFDGGLRLNRAERLATHFCGRWSARVPMFGDRHTEARLQALLDAGVLEVLQRIEGPFHGLSVSTLQTYHGGDTVFLAPPQPDPPGCSLALESLPSSAITRSDAGLVPAAAARRDGHHPSARGLPDNAMAYATWSGDDGNIGQVDFHGPVCAHEWIPYVSGPANESTRLVVEILAQDGQPAELYTGPPPRLGENWLGMRVVGTIGGCVQVRIRAIDASDAWGSWIGLGAPVHTRY